MSKDYITVVDGHKRRVRSPAINTDDVFEGAYKGFKISISKCKYGFDVYVNNSEVSFGTVYEGYYTEEDHISRCMKSGIMITPFTIEAAIQDAIRNILI